MTPGNGPSSRCRETCVVRAGFFRREEKNLRRVVPSVDISSAVVYYEEPSRIETGYEGVVGVVMNSRAICAVCPEIRACSGDVFRCSFVAAQMKKTRFPSFSVRSRTGTVLPPCSVRRPVQDANGAAISPPMLQPCQRLSCSPCLWLQESAAGYR